MDILKKLLDFLNTVKYNSHHKESKMIAEHYNNLPSSIKEDTGLPTNYSCLSPEQKDLVTSLSLCYKGIYEEILTEIDMFQKTLIDLGAEFHD